MADFVRCTIQYDTYLVQLGFQLVALVHVMLYVKFISR
jgi:hypothetical protein